jgi:predicted Fe-Mo cluster-binding NifX family protein
MDYRVAFASAGGYVDQHFGAARCFQIYDIKSGGYGFVETRETAAACEGGCEGGFGHLLKALEDCDAVFVMKIGRSAAEFMLRNGKRIFEAAGSPEAIIAELIRGRLLDESEGAG